MHEPSLREAFPWHLLRDKGTAELQARPLVVCLPDARAQGGTSIRLPEVRNRRTQLWDAVILGSP